jgi:hypothetical protein
MNAAEFDKWIGRQRSLLSVAWQRAQAAGKNIREDLTLAPRTMESALMARLRADRQVSDDDIEQTVNTWFDYEYLKPDQLPKDAKPSVFPQTRRLIATLLPLVSNRRELQARLYDTLSASYRAAQDGAEEIQTIEKAQKIWDEMHVEIDRRRVENLLLLAKRHYEAGDKKTADDLFAQAVSYPWYKIRGTATGDFQALYVSALQGLIMVRRHNLKMLQEIRPAPAVEDVIRPDLNAAIAEAQKTDAQKNTPVPEQK